MCVAYKFASSYKIPITNFLIACIGIFWGLGTVHFYMAMNPKVWFISQVMAQTFLLGAVFVFLQKLNYKNLLLSGLFWGLACYTRNDLVFSSVFFVVVYFTVHSNKFSVKSVLDGFAFAFFFIVFSIANLGYNFIRFGSFTENGIQYHKMSAYYLESYKKHGFMSVYNIPYNFYVDIISLPPFRAVVPFIGHNPEGFGFIWASPVFLIFIPWLFIYILVVFFRAKGKPGLPLDKLEKNDLWVMGGLLVSTSLIAFVILCIMGPGFSQFAARYTLDFQLFIILFMLFMFKVLPSNKIFNRTLIVLLALSMYINYAGTIYFNQLVPKFQTKNQLK